jgi:hypothetical protein
MAGCPSGQLEIDAKDYYEGPFTGDTAGPIECGGTYCSLPADPVVACSAPGRWYVTVRGHHGNAVASPSVYFAISDAATRSCAAAHPSDCTLGASDRLTLPGEARAGSPIGPSLDRCSSPSWILG